MIGRLSAEMNGRFNDLDSYFRHIAVLISELTDVEPNMDDTDRGLIRALGANARATTTALAKSLHLSRSTVQARMERLERSGVITGYTVRLNEEYERRQIKTHVMIAVAPKQAGAVVAALKSKAGMEGVTSLYAISGEFDLIAIITAPSTEAIDRTIDAIGALDGVARTNSSVVLSTKFER